MGDTPLWRAADLAEVYGVDESTVHRWERDGKLRRARRDPGGCKYWLRDEVLGDLSKGRQDSAPEVQPCRGRTDPGGSNQALARPSEGIVMAREETQVPKLVRDSFKREAPTTSALGWCCEPRRIPRETVALQAIASITGQSRWVRVGQPLRRQMATLGFGGVQPVLQFGARQTGRGDSEGRRGRRTLPAAFAATSPSSSAHR